MKILLVDNHDSFTYNLVDLICNKIGYEMDVIQSEQIALEKVNVYTHIIFSPGPGIPEEQPIMFDILKNYGTHIPILGICLGMQAIGEFFGGRLYNLAQVYHGQQHKINISKPSVIFDGLNSPIAVGLYHSWAIDANLPSVLEATAISDQSILMALQHKHHKIYGVQFHPESHLTSLGQQIIENFLRIR